MNFLIRLPECSSCSGRYVPIDMVRSIYDSIASKLARYWRHDLESALKRLQLSCAIGSWLMATKSCTSLGLLRKCSPRAYSSQYIVSGLIAYWKRLIYERIPIRSPSCCQPDESPLLQRGQEACRKILQSWAYSVLNLWSRTTYMSLNCFRLSGLLGPELEWEIGSSCHRHRIPDRLLHWLVSLSLSTCDCSSLGWSFLNSLPRRRF